MNAQLKIMNLWPHKLNFTITMKSQKENFFLIHRAFYSKPQFICCYTSLRKFDRAIKHELLHKVYYMCDHIFFISSD